MKQVYVKQKVFSIRDRYNIYDSNENIIYYCNSKILSLVAKRDLYQANDDTKLLSIEKKLLHILPKYTIYDTTQNTIATVHKKLSIFKPKFIIQTTTAELNIEGDIFAHNFCIKKDDYILFEVHKKWISWGDTYEISIYDETNIELYIALVLILDHDCHNQKRRNY
jgi:uncharacterized protein YxjI